MTTLPRPVSSQASQTSSVAASPVRTFHPLESAPALPESVRDSGNTWWEPFAWFDRGTSSWRTWQRCLVTGWTPWSGTWPRSAMTVNGIAYQRPPLVRLTDETGSGEWPTPHGFSKDGKSNGPSGNELGRAVNQSLWPIPRSADADRGGRGDLIAAARGKPNSHFRMWPTPTAINNTGGAALCKWGGAGARKKLASMVTPAELNGSLNPAWVEWLMGFPLGWTDLGPSETPLSPKSPNSSGARSSKQKPTLSPPNPQEDGGNG